MKTSVFETLMIGLVSIRDWLLNEPSYSERSRGSPHFPVNFDYKRPHKPKMKLNLSPTSKEPLMAKNRVGDTIKSLQNQINLFQFMEDVKSADSTHLLNIMDSFESIMKEFKSPTDKALLQAALNFVEATICNHYLSQEEALEKAINAKTYQSSLLYLHADDRTIGDSGAEYYTLTSSGYNAKDVLCICNQYGYVKEMPKDWAGKTSMAVPLGKWVNNDYKGERSIIDGLEMGVIQLFPHLVREQKKSKTTKKDTATLATA